MRTFLKVLGNPLYHIQIKRKMPQMATQHMEFQLLCSREAVCRVYTIQGLQEYSITKASLYPDTKDIPLHRAPYCSNIKFCYESEKALL